MLTGPDAVASTNRIAPIYLEGRLLPIQDEVSRSLGLSLHDVVRAMVEVRAEALMLKLHGEFLALPPGMMLRPGEEIWLRFVRSQGRPALQILGQAPSAAQAEAAGQAAGAAEVLRSAAVGTEGVLPSPGQPALPVLGATLAAFLARPANLSVVASLFSGNSPLASLMGAAPAMGRLNADAVRQALKRSGLFFESKLASGEPVRGDLKLALQTMLAELGQPDDDQVQLALHELSHAQVDAALALQQRELFFHFIMPFLDAPPADIQFFRPPRSEEEPDPPYTLDIHTRSEALGHLWMTAQVSRGERVELTMWAERPEVARDARRAVSELKDDMADAGLQLIHMTVVDGMRPESLSLRPGRAALGEGQMVDRTA